MVREKLTNEEINTLIEMLNNHYTLPKTVKSTIVSLFDTKEEINKAILLAYAGLYKMDQLSNEKDSKTVIIKTTSKLVIVKAVKEVLNLGLKEAKDLVDAWFNTPRQSDDELYTSTKIPLTSQLTCENMKAIEEAAKQIGAISRSITVIEFLL